MTAMKMPFASFLALTLSSLGGCGAASEQTKPRTPAETPTTTAAPVDTTSVTTQAPAGASTTATNPTSPPQEPSAAPPFATPGLTTGGPAATTPASPTMAATSGTPATMSDAEIVSAVDAADVQSLEQARDASKRAKNPRVREFARRTLTDYVLVQSRLANIESKSSISPQTSAATERLRASGDRARLNLRSAADGVAFDKAFIDARISAERELLGLLEDKLLPQAQDAELRNEIESVRSVVANHLKAAQDIQAALAK